jgi:aspartate beta-hydroxylase
MKTEDISGSTRDERVVGLVSLAEQLARQQRLGEAQRVFREAEQLQPEHPLVLHAKGRQLLLAGDAVAALAILKRLVEVAPQQIHHWMSLAAALRRLARREEEMAALERALALDPTHLIVLLQKGALLELLDKPRAAAVIYANALRTLSAQSTLAPPIAEHVRHARECVERNAKALAALLDEHLTSSRAGSEERMRFDRCVDRLLGRRRVYNPEPTGALFPFLSNYEFYPRELFPWLPALEACTPQIRDELLGVLADSHKEIQPYIAYPEGVPLNQWKELNHSLRWGAYFLWNQSTRVDEHLSRCPHTAAALAALPQVDIPARGPTAYFSILEPHTHIPPHCGVTNTRLTLHLPLILPGNCRFRVGGETREWRMGEAWVFDDTIEHEAWNDADMPRAILILDLWHPQLTTLERDLVRELTVTLQEFNDEGARYGVAGL